MVWSVDVSSKRSPISPTPTHVLLGHDDEVTCVAVNADLDVVVSGSKVRTPGCGRDGNAASGVSHLFARSMLAQDCSCIIHTLRKGNYVRSIYPPGGGCIRWLGVSSQGHIVVFSQVPLGARALHAPLAVRRAGVYVSAQTNTLHLYSINGRHLRSVDAGERLYAFVFSKDGELIITGGSHKVIQMRETHRCAVVVRSARARLSRPACAQPARGVRAAAGVVDDSLAVHHGGGADAAGGPAKGPDSHVCAARRPHSTARRAAPQQHRVLMDCTGRHQCFVHDEATCFVKSLATGSVH
jgi:hypothetical protein